MADFNLKVGNLTPAFRVQLTDENNVAINLTGATVAFRMRLRGATGTPKVNDAAATVTAPLTGEVEYQWQGTDTNTAGVYYGEFHVTFPGGPGTMPNDKHLVIEIHGRV